MIFYLLFIFLPNTDVTTLVQHLLVAILKSFKFEDKHVTHYASIDRWHARLRTCIQTF